MEPLAPIVDRMREIAREELSAPRACLVRLWDDGTMDVAIYHTMGQDERQAIIYERTTSEILWEHARGRQTNVTRIPGGELLYESTSNEREVRVIETVEPPYE